MQLINVDGTSKGVVIVAQEHLAALVSVAAKAVELSRELEDLHTKDKILIPYEIRAKHALLKTALEKYGRL